MDRGAVMTRRLAWFSAGLFLIVAATLPPHNTVTDLVLLGEGCVCWLIGAFA
jgi:hypothetical protein